MHNTPEEDASVGTEISQTSPLFKTWLKTGKLASNKSKFYKNVYSFSIS